ncbi:glycosyl transferase family 1 [Sphingopyxis sp. H038]|uniref:glycosyltransferase family 4 protein n=1 Tax=unclassified Sphingopyxis TaxID=2614943 RepID=UPI000730D972|nr:MULTISPECIES: glycosyltransferase family 4 protein [unclassified Sphingopyxis]KTE04287.1 glycosyl transferase family 1 [Sphingopyxis sp. H012]KTE10873.1 glycosyl transferase family 1 [Sphingopyxis sp. H093]KTE13512.1 glycosyl transferase family 1 [Sphingopyxis sp. H053]KTE25627.1 glycosyl transferase family 1 [Sphingopyxis sp. H080]KTE36776.1 glycosyl transferase family 1 [Sphingopyxis sp. H038]
MTGNRPVRLLHLHSSFSLGGKEARAVRLMNLMGARARHTILSAVPEALGAREAIDPKVDVDFPTDAPPLHGKPGPARYRDLARYMQQFDLILSYNWGSMDGVMAHRIMAPFRDLPPLIHHEDGFNEDESVRRNWKRSGFRRLALPTAEALVVPSALLERIAADEWGARRRTVLIRNGIDVAAYAAGPSVAIAGLERREGEVVIGTVAGLRKVKDLPRLVRAAATLPANVRLVIVGEGPERAAIAAEAAACGMGERLVMPGFMAEPARWIGHFDLLALSSRSEQAPIAVIEAMAAGLPVVSPQVGDVAAMVAAENRRFIAADEAGFRAALAEFARDATLRAQVGAANRRIAAEQFDETTMVAAYENLYGRALAGRRLFSGD